jgi:SHS2 domain-containing protein
MQVMVENLDAIRPCQERQIMVEHEALDLLLFNFLQEPVYYKDAEQLLLVVAQVEIAMHEGRYRLTATARGERLDPDRHHLRVDVKAVTLHRFRLQQSECGWKALVILDI